MRYRKGGADRRSDDCCTKLTFFVFSSRRLRKNEASSSALPTPSRAASSSTATAGATSPPPWPARAQEHDAAQVPVPCSGSHQEDGALLKDAPALLHPPALPSSPSPRNPSPNSSISLAASKPYIHIGSKENNLRWGIAVQEGHPEWKALGVQGMTGETRQSEEERHLQQILSVNISQKLKA